MGKRKTTWKVLWWPVIARNKKSITVNLRVGKVNDYKRLVQSTDILIENFRPGTLERWNMSYETLSEINPRLIMVSIRLWSNRSLFKESRFRCYWRSNGRSEICKWRSSTQPSRVGISIGDELAAMHAVWEL